MCPIIFLRRQEVWSYFCAGPKGGRRRNQSLGADFKAAQGGTFAKHHTAWHRGPYRQYCPRIDEKTWAGRQRQDDSPFRRRSRTV